MKSILPLLLSCLLYLQPALAGNNIALRDFLQADGSLSLYPGMAGSIDFSGFAVELDSCLGPVFKPIVAPGWNTLSSGLGNRVRALAISGSDVYVGGNFITAGGNSANRIARWDGSSWSALGSGLSGEAHAIAISGSVVYVVGSFISAGGISNTTGIARWDGSSWSALGSGLNGFATTIAISGSDVFVGGSFSTAGGNTANYIARWDGSSWSPLGSGLNNGVLCLAISGSNVYVGGSFTTAGGNNANYIARWNGSSWSALGSGLGSTAGVIAISGSDVYVGGSFTTAGGNSANYIARWDGSSWSSLGSGLGNTARAIAISGSDVYVGGDFTTAGGNSANRIARWEEAPLPIEWIDFEAVELEQGSTLLTWRTASETQNDYFLVQHSTDGITFYDLARIPGAGDSQEENRYEYLHENPSPGTNYYRLKQVDFDGNFEYSHIVSVNIEQRQGSARVYPNPFSDGIQVEMSTENELPVSARLYDGLGRVVWQGQLHEGVQSLEFSGIPAGVFWLETDWGNRVERVRIVKESGKRI